VKKILFTYTFLLLYTVSLLKPVYPFVDYIINYDYISKVLCVNKDKPTLKCNGKCHLKKELKSAEKEQKKSPITISLQTEKYFFKPIEKIKFLVFDKKPSRFCYVEKKTASFSTAIFRPPIL